jgi:hypothetical protein
MFVVDDMEILDPAGPAPVISTSTSASGPFIKDSEDMMPVCARIIQTVSLEFMDRGVSFRAIDFIPCPLQRRAEKS